MAPTTSADPFDEKSTALTNSCSNNGTRSWVVDRTGRSNRSMQDVRENFSGSSEYRLCYEAMNCKGFARKVMNFLRDHGDESRFLGIFHRMTSPNYLDMYVGRNQCKTFDNDTVSMVRHEYGGWFYKQRVYVTVRRSCNLAIRDKSGDVYSLTCIRTGEHYVDYNSDEPAIVRVSW